MPHAPTRLAGDKQKRASLGVDTENTRERGCGPHALQQRLGERLAGSIQTTSAGRGTGPSHAISNKL